MKQSTRTTVRSVAVVLRCCVYFPAPEFVQHFYFSLTFLDFIRGHILKKMPHDSKLRYT